MPSTHPSTHRKFQHGNPCLHITSYLYIPQMIPIYTPVPTTTTCRVNLSTSIPASSTSSSYPQLHSISSFPFRVIHSYSTATLACCIHVYPAAHSHLNILDPLYMPILPNTHTHIHLPLLFHKQFPVTCPHLHTAIYMPVLTPWTTTLS